jgi:hypothetical protein
MAAGWDDFAGIEVLTRDLAAWEPKVELIAGRGLRVLYDPDATLYALFLGPGTTTLRTDRRRQVLEAGDVAVLPPGIGIEVEPAGNFLALGDLRPHPRHFRERFIQIWGFERWPGAVGEPVEPAEGRAHRIAGFRWEVPGAWTDWSAEPWELVLAWPLSGTLEAEGSGVSGPLGGVLAVGPGAGVRVRGPGCLVGLRYRPEGY